MEHCLQSRLEYDPPALTGRQEEYRKTTGRRNKLGKPWGEDFGNFTIISCITITAVCVSGPYRETPPSAGPSCGPCPGYYFMLLGSGRGERLL